MVTLLTQQHQAQHKKQYPWKVLLLNYHIIIFLIILGFVESVEKKKTTLEGVILSEGHTPNCISHRSFLCFLTPLKMPPAQYFFFFLGLSLGQELGTISCLAKPRELSSSKITSQLHFR